MREGNKEMENKDNVYRIGDKIAANEDIELSHQIGGKTVGVIRKGTEGWVSAIEPALTIIWQTGEIHTIVSGEEEIKICGYNTKGIAQLIFSYLDNEYPIDEFMEDYKVTKEELIDTISNALSDLGLCEGEADEEPH